MMTAETPQRSRLFTVKPKCSGFPPVSASYTRGFVVTSKMSLMFCSREVRSSASISGLPLAVESVRLLDHIASNSTGRSSTISRACSMMSPHKGL